jgi:hypothetical protein
MTFFVAAKSEKAKERVIHRIESIVETKFDYVTLEKLDRTRFRGTISCESWELYVHNVIRVCQEMGRQWVLTGNIEFDFNAWTNNPKIVGVESIGINTDNPYAPKYRAD